MPLGCGSDYKGTMGYVKSYCFPLERKVGEDLKPNDRYSFTEPTVCMSFRAAARGGIPMVYQNQKQLLISEIGHPTARL